MEAARGAETSSGAEGDKTAALSHASSMASMATDMSVPSAGSSARALPHRSAVEPSIDIFRRFITRTLQSDASTVVDASGIFEPTCYMEWMRSRGSGHEHAQSRASMARIYQRTMCASLVVPRVFFLITDVCCDGAARATWPLPMVGGRLSPKKKPQCCWSCAASACGPALRTRRRALAPKGIAATATTKSCAWSSPSRPRARPLRCHLISRKPPSRDANGPDSPAPLPMHAWSIQAATSQPPPPPVPLRIRRRLRTPRCRRCTHRQQSRYRRTTCSDPRRRCLLPGCSF